MEVVRSKKQPRITICGQRALDSGLPLFVLDLDNRWVLALPGTRARAARLPKHALWIYGVEGAS